MVSLVPLSRRIRQKAAKYGVEKKLLKQCLYLSQNPQHPSLNVELLEPKQHGVYSFRIDRKYRALFFFRKDVSAIEIIAVTLHYR
ncbi:hypothetical protein HY409_03375 [Candidatus Gottesmanbacteria bacterium]|nr:hypothetical protein [Candidatus Gottesmanbacteria bacterium]